MKPDGSSSICSPVLGCVHIREQGDWLGREEGKMGSTARKQSLLQLVLFGENQPLLARSPSQPAAGSASPWQTAPTLHCTWDSSGKAAAAIAGSPDCQAAANEPCICQGCRERGRALGCQWHGLEQRSWCGEKDMCLLYCSSLQGIPVPRIPLL